MRIALKFRGDVGGSAKFRNEFQFREILKNTLSYTKSGKWYVTCWQLHVQIDDGWCSICLEWPHDIFGYNQTWLAYVDN